VAACDGRWCCGKEYDGSCPYWRSQVALAELESSANPAIGGTSSTVVGPKPNEAEHDGRECGGCRGVKAELLTSGTKAATSASTSTAGSRVGSGGADRGL
jgi:hypothetical protein